MNLSIRIPALAVLLVLALFARQSGASTDTSQARNQLAKSEKAEKAAKAKKKQAKAPNKAVTSKFLRGSEESAGERSARLKRECKGAVNAGVCAGYTR